MEKMPLFIVLFEFELTMWKDRCLRKHVSVLYVCERAGNPSENLVALHDFMFCHKKNQRMEQIRMAGRRGFPFRRGKETLTVPDISVGKGLR